MATKRNYRIVQNFDGGEILTDIDSSNILRKIFWLIVTVFHYTPVNAKQLDGLNIDGLAGKHQKRQKFPHHNFPLYGSCNKKHFCDLYVSQFDPQIFFTIS